MTLTYQVSQITQMLKLCNEQRHPIQGTGTFDLRSPQQLLFSYIEKPICNLHVLTKQNSYILFSDKKEREKDFRIQLSISISILGVRIRESCNKYH